MRRTSEAMTVAFAVFLVGHGLLHLIGVAKAFRLASLPQLTQPITPGVGLVWLVAAALLVGSAGALLFWPRWWWIIAAAGVVVSTAAMVPSWTDARFGAVANLLVGAGVLFGFLAQGPGGLRASYEADIARAVVSGPPGGPLAESDLATLPEPVQRYLRVTGALGQPRVVSFQARSHGRIRSHRDARWIPLAIDQYNVVAGERARFFYFSGSMMAVPVQGFHRYAGASATMRVKAAALVNVADASGLEMDQSETVTLFNDMCMFAPASLTDPAVVWEWADHHTARAAFTNAGHTIRAELSFNDAGELIDFRSNDRYQASPDGKTFRKLPWSTPLRDYRQFGHVRLASKGEAMWHDPEGAYAYVELITDEVRYNEPPQNSK
jgi:hypothetical protein